MLNIIAALQPRRVLEQLPMRATVCFWGLGFRATCTSTTPTSPYSEDRDHYYQIRYSQQHAAADDDDCCCHHHLRICKEHHHP